METIVESGWLYPSRSEGIFLKAMVQVIGRGGPVTVRCTVGPVALSKDRLLADLGRELDFADRETPNRGQEISRCQVGTAGSAGVRPAVRLREGPTASALGALNAAPSQWREPSGDAFVRIS